MERTKMMITPDEFDERVGGPLYDATIAHLTGARRPLFGHPFIDTRDPEQVAQFAAWFVGVMAKVSSDNYERNMEKLDDREAEGSSPRRPKGVPPLSRV